MALRLSDWVVAGEINNTRNYRVQGWLQIRDCDRVVALQLTGRCGEDLAGRRMRFEARTDLHPAVAGQSETVVSASHGELDGSGPASGGEAGATEDPPDGNPEAFGQRREPDAVPPDLSELAWQQIGPTGVMTAERKVKVYPCSPRELSRRQELGEVPPFEWKPYLFLEWFSQNGRVVIELVDPVIEFLEPDAAEDPTVAHSDASDGDDGGIAALEDEEGTPEAGVSDGAEDADEAGVLMWEDEDEEEADAYRLIPDELQEQFDAMSAELDRTIGAEDEASRQIRELELMDELIDGGPGEPLAAIFDRPVRLPTPDQMDDEQVEIALKTLLAELALFNVALDVCDHFTPREAYRLLVETICREETAYRELRRTQWVQQFMTSEFCEQCGAEIERELNSMDNEDGQESADPPDES